MEMLKKSISVSNNTINNRCSNCGECCTTFLPITKKEYYTIQKYLYEHPEITNERHIVGNDMHVLCPFRDRVNKRCKIYEVRPYVCRQFLCSKSLNTLAKEKEVYLKRAYFNSYETNIISMQRLFFRDVAWEYKVTYDYLGCRTLEDFDKKIQLLSIFQVEDLISFHAIRKGDRENE